MIWLRIHRLLSLLQPSSRSIAVRMTLVILAALAVARLARSQQPGGPQSRLQQPASQQYYAQQVQSQPQGPPGVVPPPQAQVPLTQPSTTQPTPGQPGSAPEESIQSPSDLPPRRPDYLERLPDINTAQPIPGESAPSDSRTGLPFQLPLHDSVADRNEGGWTLRQAEAIAVQFNPILVRSGAKIASAQGDALQAALLPNPRFDTNNPQTFNGPYSAYNAGFTQEIPVKGKLRLNRSAASEVVRQQEYQWVQDRYDMLTNIRKHFYAGLVAQRRAEVQVELRGIATAAVKAAQGRYEATEGTVSEVLLLQTDLQRAEIALLNTQTLLQAERGQLAAIVGRPDIKIDRLSGELTSGFPNFDVDRLRQFVVAENAQVQIALREISRDQILLRRARVEPFPNPTLGEAYSYPIQQTPGGQQFWFNIYFDIPTWNRNQGGIQAARANIAAAVASLGVLQNDLLRQVEDAWGRYISARQSEERIRTQILPTATRAQRLVKDGYEKGVLDVATFLQAQRSLNEAALSYLDALDDVWSTAAEIANLLQAEQFP